MRVTKISVKVRKRVATRAKHQCEYCRIRELIAGIPFEVEHILPEAKDGGNDESNLCYACPRCNRYKGATTHTLDKVTGEFAPLFNPRQQLWEEHFAWQENGLYILGLTPTGRATVKALQMNNSFVVRSRQVWIEAGWHPPQN